MGLRNRPTLASFTFIISLFNQNSNFSANHCEKCHPSSWWWDSNSQPLEYESPPLTTRPGLIISNKTSLFLPLSSFHSIFLSFFLSFIISWVIFLTHYFAISLFILFLLLLSYFLFLFFHTLLLSFIFFLFNFVYFLLPFFFSIVFLSFVCLYFVFLSVFINLFCYFFH